jgi:insertion element IS1 protein InsB
MDELKTFSGYKKNEQWLIYAINKGTRDVVDMLVGRRIKENVKAVVDKVLKFSPRKIYTDGLNMYPTLIDKSIHRPGRYVTNRIERKNLTLRTHLKRLNRSTLCYSKKVDMLEACVKIYLWA